MVKPFNDIQAHELYVINQDLVKLIGKLSRQLPTDNEWRIKAHDYLKRKNLISVLREDGRYFYDEDGEKQSWN